MSSPGPGPGLTSSGYDQVRPIRSRVRSFLSFAITESCSELRRRYRSVSRVTVKVTTRSKRSRSAQFLRECGYPGADLTTFPGTSSSPCRGGTRPLPVAAQSWVARGDARRVDRRRAESGDVAAEGGAGGAQFPREQARRLPDRHRVFVAPGGLEQALDGPDQADCSNDPVPVQHGGRDAGIADCRLAVLQGISQGHDLGELFLASTAGSVTVPPVRTGIGPPRSAARSASPTCATIALPRAQVCQGNAAPTSRIWTAPSGRNAWCTTITWSPLKTPTHTASFARVASESAQTTERARSSCVSR